MAVDKAVDSSVLDGYFEDIADAIREKDGTQNTYTPAQMPTAIENIPSGGSSHDWSAIGYSGEPQAIKDGYDYAVEIKNNWTPAASLRRKFRYDKKIMFMPFVNTSSATDIREMFNGCTALISVPQLNTSSATDMSQMFLSCINLTLAPQLDTSLVTDMHEMFNGCNNLISIPKYNTGSLNKTSSFNSMFFGCRALSDSSLDNILQMCIDATLYTGTKTLAQLSINSSYYSASRIQALPHYQDFINAGWTIGY